MNEDLNAETVRTVVVVVNTIAMRSLLARERAELLAAFNFPRTMFGSILLLKVASSSWDTVSTEYCLTYCNSHIYTFG
jgi:hypothetical protein